MIDRISRDRLAETLRQYVSGRVTNDTLDDLKINNEDYGVKEETFMGLSGSGDLFLTASSTMSRNFLYQY